MNLSAFTFYQELFFFSSLLCMIVSMFLFIRKSYRSAVFLLFISSLLMGIFMGILDPYLNDWDEQYHAMVAKNMINHPFVPMLYHNPVIGYSYDVWIGNHIWLHKQPLFLWQIALSLKIFGISPLAVRLPSILMNALLVFFIYRIGKSMVNNRVGYYAAVLFINCNYILEMSAGFKCTDHNDIAFLFYVTASIWAWTEYIHNKKIKWVILVGLFAGAAVLNKWLAGLMVYGGWGIAILANRDDRIRLKSYLEALLAFFISVVVFLPWQIYILNRFPNEAKFEYKLNVEHFYKPIELHHGDWKFHFQHINSIYGEGDLIPWTLLAGFILLLVVAKDFRYRIFAFVSVIAVYGFYTLATTKMISFPIIVGVFAFISFAVIIDQLQRIIENLTNKHLLVSLIFGMIVLMFGWQSLNMKSIEINHTFSKEKHNGYKYVKEKELLVFDYLLTQQPDTSYTFFNMPYMSQISFMFHKGVHAAYDNSPNEKLYLELKNKKVKMVFVDNNQNNIPPYILGDSTAKIIRSPYW